MRFLKRNGVYVCIILVATLTLIGLIRISKSKEDNVATETKYREFSESVNQTQEATEIYNAETEETTVAATEEDTVVYTEEETVVNTEPVTDLLVEDFQTVMVDYVRSLKSSICYYGITEESVMREDLAPTAVSTEVATFYFSEGTNEVYVDLMLDGKEIIDYDLRYNCTQTERPETELYTTDGEVFYVDFSQSSYLGLNGGDFEGAFIDFMSGSVWRHCNGMLRGKPIIFDCIETDYVYERYQLRDKDFVITIYANRAANKLEFNITAPAESEVTIQDIVETDIEDLESKIIDIEVLPGKHVYIDLTGTGMAGITMGEYIATVATVFSDEAVYNKYAAMVPNGEIMLVYKDGSDIREIYQLQGTDEEPRFAIDKVKNRITLFFGPHVASFDRSLFGN